MSETQNSATVILAVIFGALTGMVLLVLLAWQTGFLDWDGAGQARNAPLSTTPGMDILSDYQCRKEESKHMILGGIEDNFALGNEERVSESEAQRLLAKRHGTLSAVGVTRTYDERGFDNILLDEFSLPANTAHGIVVMKIQELSKLKNDFLELGSHMGDYSHIFGQPLSTVAESPIWISTQGIIWADLSKLTFPIRETREGQKIPQTHNSLLQLISAGEAVTFKLGDDTMADFIGFAVCATPTEHKGTTFLVNALKMPENFVSLTCQDSEEAAQCNPYKGDTSCAMQLPMACFHENFELPPEVLTAPAIRSYWSGGHVKFSPAVAGTDFETEDDVHKYCQIQFGDKWRALTVHDGGSASNVVARGKPPNSKKVWMDTKTQPYGNCWKLRPEFDDIRQEVGAHE